MRRAYLALGLCGGVLALGVHVDLLVHSLRSAGESASSWSGPAIGVALAVAALGATLIARTYRQPGALFLLALAVLGLFPNPLSWTPTTVLLLAAGFLVLLDKRGSGRWTAARLRATPAVRIASGGGVHWSVASRDDMPPESIPQPTSAASTTMQREGWGARGRSIAIALVVVAAAVVVPLSLWPQGSVAATSASIRQTGEVKVAQQGFPVPTTEEALDADAAEAEATTTTSTTTLTRIGPDDPSDPDSSVWYSDLRFGLTMAVPTDWAEVPASTLADYDPTAYHLACFADADGPTHKDAYLNGIDIRVVAGSQTEDPPPELARQTLEEAIKDGRHLYHYFQVVRSIYETEIAGIPALATTVRITWNKRVVVKSLQTCVVNHCLYLIVLQTDDADWRDYRLVFDQILSSFTFAPSASD